MSFIPNPSNGPTGAAVPAQAIYAGGTDGTNLRGIATDTTGRQKVLLYDAAGNAITSTSSALDENVKLIGGTAVDTNSGNKSAGTQRVVLATDQPTLTNPLTTRPNSRYSGDVFQPPFVGNRSSIAVVTNPAANGSSNLIVAPAYYFVQTITISVDPHCVMAAPGSLTLFCFDGTNTSSTVLCLCVLALSASAITGQTTFSFTPNYNSIISGNTLFFQYNLTAAITGSFFCIVSYGLTASTW